VLAKRLNLCDGDAAQFRSVVKQLIHDGQIELGGNNTLRLTQRAGVIIGTYRRTAKGHGFVRPEARPGAPPAGDILIREGRGLDAANGDRVQVKLSRRASQVENARGEIVAIVERATRSFVGTYFERDGEGLVRVDGTVFAHSVSVGDAGAKGVRPQDKVMIEMVRFPSADDRGEAVIVEVFGPLSKPGVDILTVIRAFGIPDEFPEAALAEARSQADAFTESLSGRTDFTKDYVITIDPVDAKDFDDAVSVTTDAKTGHTVLTVHIADVAHFVKLGGALDTEARKRGTSVYLPQRVIPMFPEVISNGLASLQQGKVRYVKTVRIEYTAEHTIADVSFYNGAIKVSRRFSYEQIQERLNALEAGTADATDAFNPQLVQLRDLALALRRKRFKRGSLELSMPEAVLEYDADGRVSGAHFAAQDLSHQIIEEFMLAANVAVAEHLTALDVPFLRRVHPAPSEEKLAKFAEFAGLLGYPLKNAQDRFALQLLLHETADKPERAAIHFALLRSLKQASYSPIQDQHFALASEHYCHFTSPIRRYPDLQVHRLLDRCIRTKKVSADEKELLVLGDHCSKTERRAEQAERELVKLRLLQHLSQRLGERYDAVITGVAEYGFFAQAEQFPAEGLVHVSSLSDDYYRYDEASHSIEGSRSKLRYRLGDRVRVEVARVDLQKRMMDWRLVQRLSEGHAATATPRPRTSMLKPKPKRKITKPKGLPKRKKKRK
jgi:ribonuclease R